MNEREAQFLKMQEERLEALEKKKADRRDASQNSELQKFLDKFGSRRVFIETELKNFMFIKDGSEKKTKLSQLLNETMQLQELLNNSMAFLPPYDLGRSQECLTVLHSDISRIQNEYMPRKKFTFGKKKNVSGVKSEVVEAKSKKDTKKYSADYIIDGKENAEISVEKSDGYKKDILLKDLNSCKITIHFPMSTLHCTNCRNCVVSLGPISGSLFLEECSSSRFHATCQQARIHDTQNSRFYLHTTGKAIIEDCKGLIFSCRSIFYEGYDADKKDAGLSDINNWKDVDDFNWLSSEPSPNFTIE